MSKGPLFSTEFMNAIFFSLFTEMQYQTPFYGTI